ncbi:MAG: hypothetical protein QXD42_05145, partial [Nitrososphaerales archaeon]
TAFSVAPSSMLSRIRASFTKLIKVCRYSKGDLSYNQTKQKLASNSFHIKIFLAGSKYEYILDLILCSKFL